MARQILVIALVFIALIGLVMAGQDSSSNKRGAEAAASVNDDTIGNTDEANAPTTSGDEATIIVEGPVGSEDAAKNAAAAQPPSSGATTFRVSAIAGAAAVAGYLAF
ncbi:PREDICTED: uncharacterized protein LOC18609634 [Theobroma cacao]|uniref:Uncharacterized protein LOC18609634 n=2 Tax=Theobroma cacao TaxID=3641 RepID=A0AB32VJL7_THECC|nr:PREDICTED: uncharacterized protein LOC18609634 [Theobroma cacao]EOY00743.1 Uncharacterized protein TCM_010669 [Theobroma cacao]